MNPTRLGSKLTHNEPTKERPQKCGFFSCMKDLLLILGSLGFAAFLIMLTLGISASGVQFWVELFF